MAAGDLFSYFVDPILRAPTLGSMLMCLTAGLVGVVVFLRKQSLVGEALSHAAYPGVMIGALAASFLPLQSKTDTLISLFILIGAFFSALAGLWVIQFLERTFKVPSDAALCFVLSSFFSVGILIASEMQFSLTSLYKQSQIYLYGQAATMTDIHIFIYGALACLVLAIIFIFYKELQTIIFDRQFAKTIGIQTRPIDILLFILIVLAVIIGIRSVGVILMSAMLIAPAVAARQFTNRLSVLLALSALFGMTSGLLGNYFSIELAHYLQVAYPTHYITLPTGPMIVLVSTFIAIVSLLFAPERGLLLRLVRVANFRYECACENVLKTMWRSGPKEPISLKQLAKYQSSSSLYLRFVLWRLARNGWVTKEQKFTYRLTPDGQLRAAKIVRLHRLWEVYLADYLGVRAERVHRNAEEMEHIITPEIERELSLLLNDPKQDPHHQPIPDQRGLDVF